MSSRRLASCLAALTLGHGAFAAPPVGRPSSDVTVERLPSGVALPYPTIHVFRGFGACVGHGRHRHEAIDLGGVGPDAGLGTPVRSLVKARVVMIGSGRTHPREFGRPLRGKGTALRGGRRLPRTKVIPGYGEVSFFTLGRGKWRSGTVIETIGLEAPLEGHLIRYMHLGAVRPDLAPGDVLGAGEELGVLGGTGVQQASPHVHIDIRGADDRPVDVAPLLGLAPTATCGEVRALAETTAKDFAEATPIGPLPPERWPAGPAADPRPAIELEPPPPPWRGAGQGPPIEGRAARIAIPDCGVFEQLGERSTELRAHLAARRWLELSLTPSVPRGEEPRLDLWDTRTSERLVPFPSSRSNASSPSASPVAVTEVAAGGGLPARLRLVVAEASDVALIVHGKDWRLRILERCKPKATAPPPAPSE